MSKKDLVLSHNSVQIHYVGSSKYELPTTPDSEFIVDDSCFIPMSEAVKQLGINPNFTGADQKTAYDFTDGKDTGIEIPINRTKNGKDIAELSSEIADQQEKIGNALKKEQEFEAYKQQKQAELEKMRPTEAKKGV